MEIGFLMDKYDPDLVCFAKEAGFDSIELFTLPGNDMDLRPGNEGSVKRVAEHFAECGIKFGSMCCSVNHFAADPIERKANNDYFKLVIENAHRFGTRLVTTNAWGQEDLSPAENVKEFKKVFSEYAKIAEDAGVRIAMENCPHSIGYPIKIANICHSPEMWDALFEEVPSKAIGLEFDPSHLFWQQINIERAIRDYGERIYAFHAKDTEILEDQMNRCGIYGNMFGKTNIWDFGVWRYRIPGWGDINWKGVFRALNDVKYKGPIFIEHEDPVLMNERHREGLELGLKFLRGFTL